MILNRDWERVQSEYLRYANGCPGRRKGHILRINFCGQGLLAQVAGYHEVQFNATGLSSGVYFCMIQAGSYVETRKLLLVK